MFRRVGSVSAKRFNSWRLFSTISSAMAMTRSPWAVSATPRWVLEYFHVQLIFNGVDDGAGGLSDKELLCRR